MAAYRIPSRIGSSTVAAFFSQFRFHHGSAPAFSSFFLKSQSSITRAHFFEFPLSAVHLRHLSTRAVRNRAGLDIGARARQLQNRRLWNYALTFSCVAGFIVIVLANFQEQMVFYVTPTDALEKHRANPNRVRFRLGGLVLEGSVVQPSSSPEMEFVVTDLLTDILVKYQGSLPDLFREGHSVVVEGFVKPFSEENSGSLPDLVKTPRKGVSEKARNGEFYFDAIEVLAKHDEKYMPKEVAVALEKNKAKIEAAQKEEDEKSRGID